MNPSPKSKLIEDMLKGFEALGYSHYPRIAARKVEPYFRRRWAKLQNRPDHLNLIETRTTRYKARDGHERAVVRWEDYEWLLKRVS